MKVLFVASYGGVSGGISRWTSHILDYYKTNAVKDCDLILSPQTRDVNIDIDTPLIKRIFLGLRDYARIISIFKQKARSDKFDVMHLTTSASLGLIKDIYMLSYGRRKGIKTIVHFRFGRIPSLANSNNWEWKLLKKVLALSDKAIVIDKKSFSTLTALGYNNIEYLPNPVSPVVNKLINNISIKRQPRTILYCGHVVPTKGIFELVEACKKLQNIKLRIVGFVEDCIKEQLVKLSGDANWLVMTGNLEYEQVVKEMLSCDIFCLPSYTEGFPNVILESMACGCPIVATNVGAIPEMLEPEDEKPFGIIVPARNIGELYMALSKMLDNPSFKEACGVNVQRRVNERYNIEAVWQRMINIWNDSLSNNKH